jgi:hypothetical protein
MDNLTEFSHPVPFQVDDNHAELSAITFVNCSATTGT